MVRGIRDQVTDRTIQDFVRCPTTCKPNLISPTFKVLRQRMVGKKISAVRRIGKRVVLDLSGDSSVVIEPRMTGLVLLSDPPDIPHLRFRWDLVGPGNYSSFWFWDRRGLGTVRLHTRPQLRELLETGNLGPDALQMNPNVWKERLDGSKREIKTVLLDQKVVAGIGNLYASEILHLSSIHPTISAGALTVQQIGRLSESVAIVLEKAIELEGSTLGDGTYRTALNKSGGYQNMHRVYMREGQSCPTCRIEKIVRIVQAQRSTFFCPKCQSQPRNGKQPRKK